MVGILSLFLENQWSPLLKAFVERSYISMRIWNLIALMVECNSRVSTAWAMLEFVQPDGDCNSKFGSFEDILLTSGVWTL